MSGETPGPLPSRKVFIHELSNIAEGAKVRFLGCVVSYDVSNATLVLEHNYPSIEAKPAQVSVNVNLIFESLKSTDLQIGVWHNVIGYVSRLSEGEREGDCEKDATLARSGHVNVQAILMWSAGSIKLGEYERILSDQGEVEMLTKG